ncbi:hypothetical protein O181_107348, partial [Austropuccinia psidii MF-1]|nr:hypothetical protein [Austropuccinia psidii MF-1]
RECLNMKDANEQQDQEFCRSRLKIIRNYVTLQEKQWVADLEFKREFSTRDYNFLKEKSDRKYMLEKEGMDWQMLLEQKRQEQETSMKQQEVRTSFVQSLLNSGKTPKEVATYMRLPYG